MKVWRKTASTVFKHQSTTKLNAWTKAYLFAPRVHWSVWCSCERNKITWQYQTGFRVVLLEVGRDGQTKKQWSTNYHYVPKACWLSILQIWETNCHNKGPHEAQYGGSQCLWYRGQNGTDFSYQIQMNNQILFTSKYKAWTSMLHFLYENNHYELHVTFSIEKNWILSRYSDFP